MKKFVLGFVLGAILFSSVSAMAVMGIVAQIADFNVIVNGEVFKEKSGDVLVVEGRTYLSLRDIADVLSLKVGWDEGTRTVNIESNDFVRAAEEYNSEIELFMFYYEWLDNDKIDVMLTELDKKYAAILRPIMIEHWGNLGCPTYQYVDDDAVLFDARYFGEIDISKLDCNNDKDGKLSYETWQKVNDIFAEYYQEREELR